MTKPIQLISPVDGRVYAERMPLSLDEAKAVAARAKAAQPAWAARPLAERIALVKAGVAKLNEMKDRIVEELAWQMGRPTRFGGEFGGVNDRTAYMSEIAESALAPTVVETSDRFERRILREPVGVVFIIAPWNYPYLTTINTLVPALIAGNTVVLKHASQTLLVGERLAEAFHAAGVPADVFQNVVLDHATTEALIGARAFNFVNFTGSVGGGATIERAAAGTFTGLGLELGGKDPGYVRSDADLDAAVDSLMDGAMFNAGQCCCGIERIYVHDSLYDAFVEKAVAWVKALKLGNPFDADSTLGPMANVRFARVVREQVAEAIAAGATPLIDPALFPADDGGAYLAPQILVNVSHDMRVMKEESFGPVVGIMKVSGDEEAIGLMNDSPYGLTCSIWTQDAEAAAAIGARIETGTVFMNRCDYLDPALCWTGCKDTGRGAALSSLGYMSVTRPKSYHLKKVTK
ncbi:aldehyde dehydrogenase family protein [Cereibacter azotoformans]|uniref:Acyl-CoA reductase-like NAD-dependent aldehyde dehydrogenase n=1 Tax=Cereibacter azotoformans TaxID=43057 RepID=A0A2T5KDE9_9RHOB|nr:aldehyde dehydrogenase family protein [Cereibacter azotoformans]AXQ93634.1 aldehyde dehydrogenase family protein [Cereibacter sphaeroides]MBO4168594.1 aldehyde dehydrogenase family protein [Cereibacter azotoformans]PTR20416.1 acyl-CoA reductase-like NAD-dependent aldehyde dehydrogenase [Cereibacter azotoformans]UIJ31974.1 aldehyde dehydrogenase family protein [Cereibacter azotoformans]